MEAKMDFNSLQAESAGLGVLLARGAAKRAKVTLADHVDEMGDVTEKAIFRRPESTEMDAALDAVDDLFFATVSSDWDDAFTRAQAVFRDLDDDCQGALQAWREVEMIRRQVADGEMDPTIGRLSADMTLAAFGRSLGAPIFAAGAEPDGWDADGADILYAMVALSGRQTSAWEPEPQLPSLDDEIARADKPETLRKNASALGKNELGQNTLLRQSVKVDDQPWRVLDIAGLEGKPVPVREWIVPQWLPVKVVTLHYADGGVGKTLLALQLMAACASGGKWCGLRVTPCKSVGLFSEDDSDELHARIDSIRRHCSLSMDKLTDMCPIDGTGQDNTLVRFQRDGQMVLTPRFNRLRQQALDTKAKLVVIDTAATTFGGNEIDRAQVTAFVGAALTGLAQDINGAVLLNAHPSLSGIASGDLRSGSTAWNNSCRSRWALTRPTDDAGKPDLRSPERILTRQKANAASSGDTVNMRWEGWRFRRTINHFLGGKYFNAKLGVS
jgi:hypothetical protein